MYKKNYTPCLSRIYPRYANLFQHLKINSCDPSINKKNHMIVSIDAEKDFYKFQHYS